MPDAKEDPNKIDLYIPISLNRQEKIGICSRAAFRDIVYLTPTLQTSEGFRCYVVYATMGLTQRGHKEPIY